MMSTHRCNLFSRLCAAWLALASLTAQAGDTGHESAERRAKVLFDTLEGDWSFNARVYAHDKWMEEIGLLTIKPTGPWRLGARQAARTILAGENLANEKEGGFHTSIKSLEWDVERQKLIQNSEGRQTAFELIDQGLTSDVQLPAGTFAAMGIKEAVRMKELYTFVSKDQFVSTVLALDASGKTLFQAVVVVTRVASNLGAANRR